MKKPILNNERKEEEQQQLNTIKVGNFQLYTKSFWITVITILCLFMLSIVWTNIYFYNKIMTKFLQHEKMIVQIMKTK